MSILVLDDDILKEFTDLVSQFDISCFTLQGAIAKVLNTIRKGIETPEKLEQNAKAIRHCAVTVGRIAAADDQYVKEIEHNDGIKIMSKVLDMKNPDV